MTIAWNDKGTWENAGMWDWTSCISTESPATITRAYLLTLDSSLTIYISRFQDTIDNCLCIYDTGGSGNDGDCGRPSISIHIRDLDYKKARGILQAVKTALNLVENYSGIVGYEVIGDINHYKTDDKTRYYLSLNLTAYTESI